MGTINRKVQLGKLDPSINPTAPKETNKPKCHALLVEKLVHIFPPTTWNNWLASPKKTHDKIKLLNVAPKIINTIEVINISFSLRNLSTIIPETGCNKKAIKLYKIKINVWSRIYILLNTCITLNTQTKSHSKCKIDNM